MKNLGCFLFWAKGTAYKKIIKKINLNQNKKLKKNTINFKKILKLKTALKNINQKIVNQLKNYYWIFFDFK